MTNVENALIRQMQKMAATLGAMQGAVNKDKGNQAAVSFQEMMQQSGGKVSSKQPAKDEAPAEKPVKDTEEKLEEGKLPVENLEEEELKPENLVGNPNAVVMELFRPEIVESTGEQAAGPILTAIPEETVQETAMNLDGQGPELGTTVDTNVGAEVSMEQQPKDFGQAMEEAPAQETAQPVQVQQPEEAPEQTVETADKPDLPENVEVRADSREEGEETGGEAVEVQQPVFRETQAVPVKVGERYETVDTQKPEMDNQLADMIRGAVQTGSERIEIHLAPQNLGSLVIEMTKDANGALQVILHTSNAKAAGVLNQHLDGLHTALQGYGQEEVRVEVQRGQESQEQHFKQADPDGKGQQQRQQQERREEETGSGQEFLQKLRLGLFGTDEL